MKYLVKLLSYLKYTLVPPAAGVLLWFSLRITQGLFQYMISFINERQFIMTATLNTGNPVTGEQGSTVTVFEWINTYMYDFVVFVVKLAYFLNKWINVEFFISWSVFIMITAMTFVIARLVLKIITAGQF